nr:hypothetical protein [Tanacetum cinerariifolium]
MVNYFVTFEWKLVGPTRGLGKVVGFDFLDDLPRRPLLDDMASGKAFLDEMYINGESIKKSSAI